MQVKMVMPLIYPALSQGGVGNTPAIVLAGQIEHSLPDASPPDSIYLCVLRVLCGERFDLVKHDDGANPFAAGERGEALVNVFQSDALRDQFVELEPPL